MIDPKKMREKLERSLPKEAYRCTDVDFDECLFLKPEYGECTVLAAGDSPAKCSSLILTTTEADYEPIPAADILALLSYIEKLERVVEAGKKIRQPLGPCDNIDHHGNCQSHFVSNPCPVKEFDAALDALNGGEE